MTNWQNIAEQTIGHSRRSWAARHLIAKEAAQSLIDVSALLDTIDESWNELEAIHDRLRHAAKRLDHKRNAQPVDLQQRLSLFDR